MNNQIIRLELYDTARVLSLFGYLTPGDVFFGAIWHQGDIFLGLFDTAPTNYPREHPKVCLMSFWQVFCRCLLVWKLVYLVLTVSCIGSIRKVYGGCLNGVLRTLKMMYGRSSFRFELFMLSFVWSGKPNISLLLRQSRDLVVDVGLCPISQKKISLFCPKSHLFFVQNRP